MTSFSIGGVAPRHRHCSSLASGCEPRQGGEENRLLTVCRIGSLCPSVVVVYFVAGRRRDPVLRASLPELAAWWSAIGCSVVACPDVACSAAGGPIVGDLVVGRSTVGGLVVDCPTVVQSAARSPPRQSLFLRIILTLIASS